MDFCIFFLVRIPFLLCVYFESPMTRIIIVVPYGVLGVKIKVKYKV